MPSDYPQIASRLCHVNPKTLIIGALLIVGTTGACSGDAEDSARPGDASSTTSTPTADVAAPATTTTTTTTTPATTESAAPTTTTEAPRTEPVEIDLEEPLWRDVTESTIGETSEWTNKVELADLDSDGDVDILFANGGGYALPGPPVANRAWINDGSGLFEDRSSAVFGEVGDLARVIKVRDLDGDSIPDIFVGTTFETQSRLYLGKGGLEFEEVTETHLPQRAASIGDAEVGDVDADGDLDIILADWGPGHPEGNGGSRPLLWRNEGSGRFVDVSDQQIPDIAVEFSWELEFVDADNDYDLDIAVSCHACTGGFLLRNDGAGVFEDASANLPQFGGSYDFEVIDLDGDGFQDLITVNDGPRLTEHVFLGDGDGGFVDATEILWPEEANAGLDDNMVAVLDYDSDGDPDFFIGQLGSADRIMMNDGRGNLTKVSGVFGGDTTDGTFAIAFGDLNGDTIVDVVEAQAERARDNRVYFGDTIAPDTAPPVIAGVVGLGSSLHARIHDNKTPIAAYDLHRVYAVGPEDEVELTWYGESLWRANAPVSGDYQVCAIDRALNETCSDAVTVSVS